MEVSGRRPKTDGGKASAEDFSLFCHPCNGEGRRVAAHGYCKNCSEYLCEGCYKVHRKPTPTKHHVLVDIASMPQQPPTAGKGPTPEVKCTKVCPNHADKVVEVYCVTHDTAVCGLCAFRSHSKPCQVEDINEKARNYRTSQEYTNIKDDMDMIEKEVNACLNEVKQCFKDNEETSGNAIREIKKFTADMITYLKKKETDLLMLAKKMQGEDGDKLKTVEADCQVVKSNITQLKTTLTKHEDQNGDLFVTTKQAITQVRNLKERLAKYKTKNKASQYTFQPDQDLGKLLTSQRPLGSLNKDDRPQAVRKSTNIPVRKVKNLASAEVTKLSEIHIKLSEDKKNCKITGATLLSPNRLLVVDSNNESVKSIDTVDNTVTSCLKLSSEPWGITALHQQQAAITLPKKSQIQVLSTTGELSFLRSIPVKGQCYGIGSTDDKLVVLYVIPGKVEVMNLHGGVLHTISSDVCDKPMFKHPWYVTVTSEGNNETMIYVSDRDTHSITKMNLQGKVILIYKDNNLSDPRGLMVTQDGQMLICNWNNNNIYIVSPDGKKTGILLDKSHGIIGPYSVSYCPVESKVYVSCYHSAAIPATKNYMKVFKLN